MAKADLVLPDGTKVTIDGTADEVALLLSRFSQPISDRLARKGVKKRSARKSRSTSASGTSAKRVGPVGHITALADEGYFKSKRTLGDIQKKLEEKGHIYAQTSLSPSLIRLVRKRTLRRLKENKGWVYVN